jgi:fatty-acyl-CoA synthase
MDYSNFSELGVATMLHRRAQISAHRTAITFEGSSLTFQQLSDRTRSLASAFQKMGLKPGSRIAYLGFNNSALLEVMFAAASMGGVFVAVNFRLTGDELTYILNDSEVEALFVDDDLYPVINPVRSAIGCEKFISVQTPVEGDYNFNDLIAQNQPLQECYKSVPDETAVIMYTSGTTGKPKGAMLTHSNLYWNFVNTSMAVGFMESDVTLVCAPLFHIGGLNVTTLGTLFVGGHAVILKNFDPENVLKLIEEMKISTMFGAPTMFQMMALQDRWLATDLSSLRVLMVGAAPVPEPLIHAYNDRGVPFCQGYGLTETAPLALILQPDNVLAKVGSAGKAPMFTDVQLVDANNDPVPVGERGEVVVRGPNVMKGYLNRPDATLEAIDENGWFHTGDVAYMDDDGFFFICDRLKDMIITGGENVYPAEVESVLLGHDAIVDVAVLGVSDEKWGEAVIAVAVLAEGQSLTLSELREYGTHHLARYKLPLQLYCLDELPRNPSGKVLKFKMREQYSG